MGNSQSLAELPPGWAEVLPHVTESDLLRASASGQLDIDAFDLDRHVPLARMILQAHPHLKELRFKLVPERMGKEEYWRALFEILYFGDAAAEEGKVDKEEMKDDDAAGGKPHKDVGERKLGEEELPQAPTPEPRSQPDQMLCETTDAEDAESKHDDDIGGARRPPQSLPPVPQQMPPRATASEPSSRPPRSILRTSTNVTIDSIGTDVLAAFDEPLPSSRRPSIDSLGRRRTSVDSLDPEVIAALKEIMPRRRLTVSCEDGMVWHGTDESEDEADEEPQGVRFAPELETVVSDEIDEANRVTQEEEEDVSSQKQSENGFKEEPSANDGPFAPAIIEATVSKEPGAATRVGLLIKRGATGGIMIYHVEENSVAADSCLSVGDEILAVNDEAVHCEMQCLAKLLFAFKHGGEARILASRGERPRGYSYVLARKAQNKFFTGGINGSHIHGRSGSANDVVTTTSRNSRLLSPEYLGMKRKHMGERTTSHFAGGGSEANIIDGLRLEERAYSSGTTKVKVVQTPSFAQSAFHGLNLNKGDVICAIGGTPVSSNLWAKIAWKVSSGPLVPILTHNLFRRFRLALMANMSVADKDKSGRRSRPSLKNRIPEEYDFLEKLGEGTFSVVNRAIHRTSKRKVAIKTINRMALSLTQDESIKNQIVVLQALNHVNILQLHDEVTTLACYYLVTECLGGSLFEYLGKKGSYTEADVQSICSEIFDALGYIHSKGLAHRNLKPRNIMLSGHADPEVKLVDFGFAKTAQDDHSLITLCGSLGYQAPEMLRRMRYGTKVDMFSAGAILFTMIGGERPFEANTEQETHRLTKAGNYSFDSHWDAVSDGAKDTIRSLLVIEQGQRASANEVLSQPWMTEKKESLPKRSLLRTQRHLRRLVRSRSSTVL